MPLLLHTVAHRPHPLLAATRMLAACHLLQSAAPTPPLLHTAACTPLPPLLPSPLPPLPLLVPHPLIAKKSKQ
jgi:hypothetical protein